MGLQSTRPFRPVDQATVSIAVTSSSANVALAATSSEYMFVNLGTDTVFVRLGNSSVSATVPSGATGGSTPVPAGAVIVLKAPVTAPTHVAAIAASATATLYIAAGEGM